MYRATGGIPTGGGQSPYASQLGLQSAKSSLTSQLEPAVAQGATTLNDVVGSALGGLSGLVGQNSPTASPASRPLGPSSPDS